MKNRFFIALPMAVSLMVPAALAQSTANCDGKQDNGNQYCLDVVADRVAQAEPASAAPQSSSSQATQGRQPGDDLGPHQPLQPETRQGFWGHMNPFARKKYVQNQLSPIRNRVNELDELTAKNSTMLKDVDARATEGIRQASAKANEADQHALDAGNRAQQANTTAQQASTRLQTVEQVVGTLDQYEAKNQLELRFRPGQLALSKRDKDALDQVADQLKSQKGFIVEIQGFSPGRGEAAVQNSQKMADSVVRYLVLNHSIPVYRIYQLGMGNAPVESTGDAAPKIHAKVSRVEVTVLTNGVDQLAQR
jgi:outer membrane protein OmpA-like peptidoglycan-associated protein